MNKSPLTLSIAFSTLIVIIFSLAILFHLEIKSEKSIKLFGERVGVMEIRGVITDSFRAIETLDEFRRDSRICGIVIRVDSPGGGISPSQEICQEIRRTASVKPVVCSMGSVAASGGLYIAVACTKIVANPGTLTGSIGVISTIPNLQGFFEKIGIKVETIKSGVLKGTGRLDRALTQNERLMLQDISEDFYNQFIDHVAESRHISVEKIKSIADGRVFSGRRAQELGLVDELGNYWDAIRLLSKLGGISGWPTLVNLEDKAESWLGRFLKEKTKGMITEFLEKLNIFDRLQYFCQLAGST